MPKNDVGQDQNRLALAKDTGNLERCVYLGNVAIAHIFARVRSHLSELQSRLVTCSDGRDTGIVSIGFCPCMGTHGEPSTRKMLGDVEQNCQHMTQVCRKSEVEKATHTRDAR